MKFKVNQTTVYFKIGDITKESVEAIVNAANSGLRGGGGVDGAIHRAGGPRIMEECRKIGSCPPGQAVVTTGGNLAATYVIHTVGPIYRGGQKEEASILHNAYLNCLRLAKEKGIQSIAFPSISTGIYGYPIEEAAEIALRICFQYAKQNIIPTELHFVLFSQKDFDVYRQTLKKLFP